MHGHNLSIVIFVDTTFEVLGEMLTILVYIRTLLQFGVIRIVLVLGHVFIKR